MLDRITAALLFTSGMASAQLPSFGPVTNYNAALAVTSPHAVAINDVNGDSIPDIIAGDDLGSFLSIHLGSGGGAFAPALPPSYSGLIPVFSIAVGDLNADGNSDIVCGGYAVTVLFGVGSGNFGPPLGLSGVSSAESVMVGDMNLDGTLDIITANSGGAGIGISVLLGDGLGGFSGPTNGPVTGSCRYGTLADLNLDGKLDVVLARQVPSPDVSVLLGDGTGAFAAPLTYTTNSVSFTLAVGDLNLDGKPDVVTDHGAVLMGDGLGGLTLTSVLAGPLPGYGVALSDVNGDGVADVVVRNEGTNPSVSLFVYTGDGQGGFGSAVNFVVSPGRGVAVTDLDNDGSADIVTGGTGVVSVLLNQLHLTSRTTGYCFGDGTSATCPCGTSAAGNGCPNSASPVGARLASTGYAGVTYDTFKLVSTGVPNGPGLYFQGTGTTDLPFFGDGKFCAGIGVVRLRVTFASGNSSSYPDATFTTPIHTAGSVPGAGGTRHYQVWYRDTDPTFCTPSLFNLTNGLSVAWVP